MNPIEPDKHLQVALRHAPDANTKAPPELTAQILAAAHRSARERPSPLPEPAVEWRTRLMAWWRLPQAHAAMATVLLAGVVGLLWRWFYNTEFGLFNAYLVPLGLPKIAWLSDVNWAMPAIVIMTLWWTLGGPMLVFLAAIQNIPTSYNEAAAIDGATEPQIFWRVTLPLLRPVLLFSMVMNVVGSFQVFGQVFMITRGGPELSTRTLVQYIYDTAFNNYRMGYAAAISWLLFLVIAAFSIIQFRLMREKK